MTRAIEENPAASLPADRDGARRRWGRRLLVVLVAGVVLAAGALATGWAGDQHAGASSTSMPARPDIAGTFDVGGRKMYLQCTGQGSPTVVLISGGGIAADVWDSPLGKRPKVYPTIAKTTRVCAYDRPGTTRAREEGGFSRSDPVPQPVTPSRSAHELRALLHVAGEQGPFVLAAHSYGGLVARYYAHKHPRQVAGMVLIDSFSPELREAMPEQWSAWMQWNATPAAVLEDYPDYERVDFDHALDEIVANRSIEPMPLVVLTADQPYPAPADPDLPPDISVVTRAAQDVSQRKVAQLVPGAEHITETHSGHDIMLENPRVVSHAIREVVAAVRDGRTSIEQGKHDELTPVVQSVPSTPRWYPGADGRIHLQYELMLTNTVPVPVDVTKVVTHGDGKVVATLQGDALQAALAPLGSETGSTTELPPSSVAVVWMDLTFESRDQLPAHLTHELTVDLGEGLPIGPALTYSGGIADISRDAAIVIAPPLRGGPWVAAAGVAGPHRRALQAVNGKLHLGQRFAVDFAALLDGDGRSHTGDPTQAASYFDYDRPVLAVGDGTVVKATDDLADQVPNQNTPTSLEEEDGNAVILRLDRGIYVAYGHLKPGSVRVEAGQRVRTGEVIGKLGNSGNSTGPHLHMQLMTDPSFLASDGLPFVFDGFRLDGTVPSLDALLAADEDGTPMPIDTARAGARHRRGLTGLDVVTFPSSASTAVAPAQKDFSGLVDIGGGRQLSAECRGQGSPTVVLISGKGTDAADWMQIADPSNPAVRSPGDDVGAGLVGQVASDAAVFPSVARFTRVCAYDRPDTRLTGADRTTPRGPEGQPHTVDQDVRDLHRLLRALDEPEPYVLVPHSYGGWIAELYARTYPRQIGGLVMVDAATALLRDVMTPDQLATWDAANRQTSPQVAEGVRAIDAIDQIRAAGPMPKVPAIVLSADKPYRTDLLPAGTDPDASLTFADWLQAQDRLAKSLGAEHVTTTHSGHHVYLYSPALVVHAIRTIVDDVR
jgi:pimeloyl-ACP methyl ester carboxylesterase